MKLELGLVQIYTGEGKGKTTAAIGQGIRAAGNGLRVYMVQFLKSGQTGELKTIKELENFKLFRFERPRGFFWTLNEAQKLELRSDIDLAMKFVAEVIENNYCDLLILDEVLGCISNKLIELEQLLAIISRKPESMEIVMTGRNAPDELISIADYVSEIRAIKHPFSEGISARKGIEY